MVNIQSNALKFTKQNGSIKIVVELLKAELTSNVHAARSEWFFKESYSSMSDLSDSE